MSHCSWCHMAHAECYLSRYLHYGRQMDGIGGQTVRILPIEPIPEPDVIQRLLLAVSMRCKAQAMLCRVGPRPKVAMDASSFKPGDESYHLPSLSPP